MNLSTRRSLRRLVAILSVLVAVVALASACSSSKKSGSSNTGSSIPPNTVFVQDFAFNPNTLSVPVGTKVTWQFKDSAKHTVKGDGGLASEEESSGGTYEFTFNTAGTFNYVCSIHPNMHGAIRVT